MLYPSHTQMPRRGGTLASWTGRWLMKLTGWKFEGTPPDLPRLVLAVAPHTSNWDFFVGVMALWALDLRLSFLGKHTIFVWPVSAWLRAIGGIPVDRNSAHGFVGEVIYAFAGKEQMWFALAPEGTRKKVERFRSGFLHIAAGAGVPVLLVYLDFEKRVIGFGPLLNPSVDVAADLAQVEAFYRTVQGCNPENQLGR
jgi:1-acyl-sn-glycerol-3-phosphate acyltransferase